MRSNDRRQTTADSTKTEFGRIVWIWINGGRVARPPATLKACGIGAKWSGDECVHWGHPSR